MANAQLTKFRVEEEKKELDLKIDKLTSFLSSQRSVEVSSKQIVMLYDQLAVMRTYSYILSARLANWEETS